MALGDGVIWNEAWIDDNTVANLIDDHHNDTMKAIRSRMAREHIWANSQTATNEAGHHNFVTFQMQTAAPTMAGTTAGGLYIGSSASGYPLMFVNSAGTTTTLVNSASLIPLVSGGTQGSIPICSSANPNSLILLAASAPDYVLTTQTGTGAPVWKSPTALISGLYGTWVDKSADYAAQVATRDGMVVGIVVAGASPSAGRIIGFTDGNANPTTTRGGANVWVNTGAAAESAQNNYNSFNMPVRKGDYWKITAASSANAVTIYAYWISVGS